MYMLTKSGAWQAIARSQLSQGRREDFCPRMDVSHLAGSSFCLPWPMDPNLVERCRTGGESEVEDRVELFNWTTEIIGA